MRGVRAAHARNNVTRTSGTVALDAEKHHKHHRKAQQRGESQRPLDAEDGSRNGRGSRLMPPCGKRLHKNHQHRCTHGTCDLPRGVRDRRSGRHLIRSVQAVQRPCGNRHKQESHADLTRELANRHPPNPCIHRHQRHAERTDGQHNRAAQRHWSRAKTVHRPPAEELGNALAEGTRQHNQAAHGGRIATVGLDIQRHDDQNRAERKERQRCRDGADGKGPILQHFKIQQRRLGSAAGSAADCAALASRYRRP